MRIFIFGSAGMLGNYLSLHLSSYYSIINVTRNQIDASKANTTDICNYIKTTGFEKDDIIINAVGTIKPRVDELGDLNAILVNSAFPHFLAKAADMLNLKLIHITTDCVFAGNSGSYSESDKHDISDVYGRTKSLGEPKNCTVIRTSIIGEEKNTKRSLVEWIKSNKGKTITGYTNHYWNGLTCLQVSKTIHSIITSNSFWTGVRHIHSPSTLSKYELLVLVSDIYKLEITVEPKETEHKCDRSLSTLYPTFNVPELKFQITEMMQFKIN